MSKRSFLFLCWLVFTSTLIGGDDTAAAQKRFVGTWQARFNGKVFMTVLLEPGEKLSGTVSTGHITVNDDGDLTEAEPSDSDRRSDIMYAKILGNRLTFEIDDGGEVMKFEMTITAEGKSELRFVGAPVKIKPILFERVP